MGLSRIALRSIRTTNSLNMIANENGGLSAAFPVSPLLLAAVHQAVVHADHGAGLADESIPRRVVLATIVGVGAAASVIRGGSSVIAGGGNATHHTGADRGGTDRGPTPLPAGDARDADGGQRTTDPCLRALDRQRDALLFGPVKREHGRACEDGDRDGSFSQTCLFHGFSPGLPHAELSCERPWPTLALCQSKCRVARAELGIQPLIRKRFQELVCLVIQKNPVMQDTPHALAAGRMDGSRIAPASSGL